jgi:ABC-type proline/glycine betaine transport system permease subunit
VLQRWPRDPASWDLQWELARAAALKGQWGEVSTLLAALRPDQLPAPLAARQLFWQGLAAENQGDRAGAERFWRQVLPLAPGGYYGWRARVRLGELEERDPRDPQAPAAGPGAAAGARELPWQSLASGDPLLDRLWRLDLPLEAWELWRTRRGGRPPQGPGQLLLEGRLRTGIGDDWTGLGQLDQAALRLPAGSCRVQWQREQQLHPRRYGSAFARAAAQAGLDPNLLFGVARQESRFTAGVSSAVGAVGLLQTVPSLALLAVLVALLGRIGFVPALLALFAYALLPIVGNTIAGLAAVPAGLVQAAQALGLSRRDVMRHVMLPLALPVLLAGVTTAAVINVGTATVAAFVGAGGLGERIVAGLAVNDPAQMLAGALPAALLAVLVQAGFGLLERRSRIPG